MKIVTIRESDETNYRSNNNVSIGQANNSSNTRPVIGPTGGTWRWFSESKNTSERFYGSNWTPYNDRNFVIVTITGDIEEQTLSFLADVEDRYGNVQENKQINIYLPEIDTENSNVPCNADHCSPFTFRNQESLVILLVDEFGSTYYLPVVDTPYFEEENQDGEWVQGRAHYTDWNTALSEEYIARRGLVPHNNRGFQISG